MALSDDPARRHREVAGAFSDLVAQVEDWDAPAPVPGWTARSVVEHLTGWFPGFLAAGAGIELARGPAVEQDPVAAWRVHTDAVQAVLDAPDGRVLRNPHIGELPVAVAIDRFYTADVFMHTWDLGRAVGRDVLLDADLCAELLAGMAEHEDAMRAPGQYGPAVPVPDDAPAQDRMLGFIGRDPSWR